MDFSLQQLGENKLYAGGAIVFLALFVVVLTGHNDPLAHIPGPWYARWTGLVTTYYTLRGRKPSYVHSLHAKYGPVVRFGPSEVDFSDPVAAQSIHRIKNAFRKAEWYRNITPNVNHIVNLTDVETHRRHRRLLSAPLSESGLKVFLPQIDSRVRLAISRMAEEAKASPTRTVDVYKWFIFMATDVIGELSFGESFRMLEHGKINQYALDMQAVARAGAVRVTFPILTRLSMLLPIPLPLFEKPKKTAERLRGYATQSLARHRALVETSDTAPPTLLSKLYRAEEAAATAAAEDSNNKKKDTADVSLSLTMTPDEVRDNAQAYIVAGSDTTSNTLTYLVWSVCRDRTSGVRARLLEALAGLPEDFSDEDLRGVAYLEHVIDETLRLHPAVPAPLPRVVPPEGAELAGYRVPPGIVVSTQARSLHKNPEAFPDPERFIPERWENPTKLMKDSFMPFGGGSRICIGLHLARIELRLATARFFRAFPNAKVSTSDGMSDADMAAEEYFLFVPRGHRCLIDLY
ncbi:cytochrome P450 [Biscogniauxia mediterranea]|nr:cytochrome P450 [Biscogniauxia mediterranea]